jgi:HAD superfamily hydrolase (TIGR01458 family)
VARIEGVLLDVDGVLTVSWRALPGAAESLRWLREHAVPFLLATNTTTLSRADLASTLRGAGLEVEAAELVTAPVAAAASLRVRHPGAGVFLLGGAATRADLDGVRLVDRDADVVLVAGADDELTWGNLNRAFRMLRAGAALVAMHRNVWWETDEGPTLDSGPFIDGLAAAAGVPVEVTGKPAPTFFRDAVAELGVEPGRAAMVGDDLRNDVLAAQAAGLTGVLVRTGKFRDGDLEGVDGRPDLVIDSIADLPEALR